MKNKMIGIDIGGSTIKIGLLNLMGEIIKQWEIDTIGKNGGESIVSDIWASLLKELSSTLIEREVIGIGVGAPGFVNVKAGVVYEAVNIGWQNYNLIDEFRTYSDLPIFIENDANLAALGENWLGAGKQAEYLLAVTLGTGVGSGIIINGKIVSGFNGTAGEMGHIIQQPNGYQCNCGRTGCLDTIVSARGIVKRTIDQLHQFPESTIHTYLKESEKITTKVIFEQARNKDELCHHIIEETADYLGYALASAATIVNPSIILIGGGVSKAGEQLIKPVKKAFRQYSLERIYENCEIKATELGNNAGIIGAGYLVYSSVDIPKLV